MSLNLAEVFFQKAATQPDHPLILGPRDGSCISYGEFQRGVQIMAERLRTAGIGKGMNIGLHYPSDQNYITFTYALWVVGASVTPIPMELANEEKQQILQLIAIDALISSVRFCDVFEPFVVSEASELNEQARLLKVKTQRQAPPELAAINPAFIRFTSGTTGSAKGVVLSHETILERINAANQGLHIGPEDCIVWLLSMAYHFTVSIVAYLSFGATIVLPKNAFGVSLLRAAIDHKATMIYGAPTHYELMTHDRSDKSLPQLRFAIVTTARLSTDLAEAFYQRFGLALNETYGIIEIGLPAINIEQPREKQGSVGQLLPAYFIKLVRQPGQNTGEILLNGPGLLDAYYEPWQGREEILEKHNGWLATGDLAVMDDAGFLTIVGRSKEMISVAGMKFFPQEVEKVLERHPYIQAACVFGIKVSRLGESPIAHLVLNEGCNAPDENALNDHCAKVLASYKIPSQFQWVACLARTASGKLIRNADKLLNTDKPTTNVGEQHDRTTSAT
ncbi:MAG: hypothetical protein COA42_23040 [Alteromonadaceae bacterium]|nr:MAG: hypothetical protein COA42_23040 [Alteromonadaceae bacterium]